MSSTPIAVDLDGTFIKIDVAVEALLMLATRRPMKLLQCLWSLREGRAAFKFNLDRCAQVSFDALPVNSDLLAWLKDQKAAGRKIVLATAATERVAKNICDKYSMIFDHFIASDKNINLKGEAKADALEALFGGKEYCYAGNDKADLAIWQRCRSAVLAGPNVAKLNAQLDSDVQVEYVCRTPKPGVTTVLKQMRLHQWAKNILVFLPALAGQQLTTETIATLTLCFFVFSLCSSSVYVANDLLDIQSDRLHSTKRNRPIAAGNLSISLAVTLYLAITITFIAVALTSTPKMFQMALLVYFIATWSYSLVVKRVAVADLFMLAFLYTMRMLAGALAVATTLSPWLVLFSMFLFTSLAAGKRHAEIIRAKVQDDRAEIIGRGYQSQDDMFVFSLGIASGAAAAVILSLYIGSSESQALYNHPDFLLISNAIFMYWIAWVWFKAGRGQLNEDPVIFALKDKTSLISGACFITSVIVAAVA